MAKIMLSGFEWFLQNVLTEGMRTFFYYDLLPILFNMTLTASIVILFVLLARLILKKLGAPTVVSYALWAVVLFRLLCPVSFSAPFSLLGALDTPTVTTESGATRTEYVPKDIVHMEYPAVDLPIPGVSEAINETLPYGEAQLGADPLELPMLEMNILWLAGLLGMLLYSIVSYLTLRMRLFGAAKLEKNIWLADRIAGPFVMGLFRPKIYLPSGLPESEREYIILHEQHHIRRLDHVVKVLAFAALCVHWFNPLVWLAFHLSGKDMEMSCDEAVIKKLGTDIRADYSASLLSLATGRRILVATPLAFGEGDTKGRIKNLAKWKKPAVWITVVAVLLCAVVIVLCAANSSGEESKLKVRLASDGVEVTCRFGDEVDDWAVYEDIYLEGELISSKAVLINGEHPERADASKKFDYVFKTNVAAADGGGFSGALQYSAVDENGTVMSREVKLPRERYTASGTVLSDGSKNANGIRRELTENGEAVLFSVILSTDPDGSVTAMHKELGVTGANDTVVQYRLVTSDHVQLWPEATPASVDFMEEPYTSYVSYQCLYMNPLSSYFAGGGDSGYRYEFDENGVRFIKRGSEYTEYAEYESGWVQFPWSEEEWEGLFSFRLQGQYLDAGAYSERLYRPLSNGHCLLRMDGALWLVKINENPQMGKFIWSIYSLVPEAAMGNTVWEYEPMFSSRSPWFPFEFDMEYDELSAVCTETYLVDRPEDGQQTVDHVQLYPEGSTLYWSPVNEEGRTVKTASIHFSVNQDEKTVCGGTIYINRDFWEPDGSAGYIARLVGTGLVMEQNPDGGAIIRLR